MTTYRVPFELKREGNNPAMKEIEVVAHTANDAEAKAEQILVRQFGRKAKIIGFAVRYVPPSR
jgi:hypothetical protein